MISAPRHRFREARGDMWKMAADAHCITTNGDVRKDGAAVMGRGCALEAAAMFPAIRADLGYLINEHGNHVHLLGPRRHRGNRYVVYSFPVKHHWNEWASFGLIERSAYELMETVESQGYSTVLLPRPGCGNGHLQWEEVRQVLSPILDDRIVIVSR